MVVKRTIKHVHDGLLFDETKLQQAGLTDKLPDYLHGAWADQLHFLPVEQVLDFQWVELENTDRCRMNLLARQQPFIDLGALGIYVPVRPDSLQDPFDGNASFQHDHHIDTATDSSFTE